jgi:hypothetical protein
MLRRTSYLASCKGRSEKIDVKEGKGISVGGCQTAKQDGQEGIFILLSAHADASRICTCCGCKVSFILLISLEQVLSSFLCGRTVLFQKQKGRDRRQARDHMVRENKDGRQHEAVSGCRLTQLNWCDGHACACTQDWQVRHPRDQFITDH